MFSAALARFNSLLQRRIFKRRRKSKDKSKVPSEKTSEGMDLWEAAFPTGEMEVDAGSAVPEIPETNTSSVSLDVQDPSEASSPTGEVEAIESSDSVMAVPEIPEVNAKIVSVDVQVLSEASLHTGEVEAVKSSDSLMAEPEVPEVNARNVSLDVSDLWEIAFPTGEVDVVKSSGSVIAVPEIPESDASNASLNVQDPSEASLPTWEANVVESSGTVMTVPEISEENASDASLDVQVPSEASLHTGEVEVVPEIPKVNASNVSLDDEDLSKTLPTAEADVVKSSGDVMAVPEIPEANASDASLDVQDLWESAFSTGEMEAVESSGSLISSLISLIPSLNVMKLSLIPGVNDSNVSIDVQDPSKASPTREIGVIQSNGILMASKVSLNVQDSSKALPTGQLEVAESNGSLISVPEIHDPNANIATLVVQDPSKALPTGEGEVVESRGSKKAVPDIPEDKASNVSLDDQDLWESAFPTGEMEGVDSSGSNMAEPKNPEVKASNVSLDVQDLWESAFPTEEVEAVESSDSLMEEPEIPELNASDSSLDVQDLWEIAFPTGEVDAVESSGSVMAVPEISEANANNVFVDIQNPSESSASGELEVSAESASLMSEPENHMSSEIIRHRKRKRRSQNSLDDSYQIKESSPSAGEQNFSEPIRKWSGCCGGCNMEWAAESFVLNSEMDGNEGLGNWSERNELTGDVHENLNSLIAVPEIPELKVKASVATEYNASPDVDVFRENFNPRKRKRLSSETNLDYSNQLNDGSFCDSEQSEEFSEPLRKANKQVDNLDGTAAFEQFSQLPLGGSDMGYVHSFLSNAYQLLFGAVPQEPAGVISQDSNISQACPQEENAQPNGSRARRRRMKRVWNGKSFVAEEQKREKTAPYSLRPRRRRNYKD